MKIKSVVIALLTLLVFFPAYAGAAAVGKLTSVEGKVDITSPGKEARPAGEGDALNVGDIIRAKSKSKCEVTFGDGNILRLAENTRIKVTEYMFDKGPRNEVLNLFRGKIQNIVQKITDAAGPEKAGRYEIHTPTAVAGVRGTNFFAYHQAGVSGAIFKEGTGYGYSINRPQDVRTITTGQAMVVTSPNRPPTVRPATTQEMEQHQKETAPAEKKAKEEGGKKDGDDKKADASAAKTDDANGKKDDKETKSEEAKKTETDKAPESAPKADQAKQAGDNGQQDGTTGAQGGGATTGGGSPASLAATTQESAGQSPTTQIMAGISQALTSMTTTSPNTPSTALIITPATYTQDQQPIVIPFEKQDTTPPEISFTAQPSSLTNSPAATFTLASTETGTTYRYSFDDINYTNAAGSTISLSALSEGQHTIYVKGTDTAGNSSTPISYVWTTDYTAPVITITPGAAPIANGMAVVKVALSGSKPADFSSTLDGTTPAAGSSLTFDNVATGNHTLNVQAKDAAGNIGTRSLSFTLSRYDLAGNSYSTAGSGAATAQVAYVPGENWGGWNLNSSSASVVSAGGGTAATGVWIVPPDKTFTYLTNDFFGKGTSVGSYQGKPLLYANNIEGDLYRQNKATIHSDSYEKPISGSYFDTMSAEILYVKSLNPANLPGYGLQMAKKEMVSSDGRRSNSWDVYYPHDEAFSYGSSNNVPRMNRVRISNLSILPDFSTSPPTMPLPSEYGYADIAPAEFLGNPWPVTAGGAVGTKQYAKTFETDYDLNVMERVLPPTPAQLNQTFTGIMGASQLDAAGSASSLWATDSSHPLGLTFLGNYQDQGAAPPLIFNLRRFYSRNYAATGAAPAPTPDGGAYHGVMTGTLSSDGSLDAALYGLYVSPTTNGTWEAGILKTTAPLTGRSYAGLNMWEADGLLFRIPKALTLSAGVDAAHFLDQELNYLDAVHFTNIRRGALGDAAVQMNGLSGRFNSNGAITSTAGAGFGNTLSIRGLPDFGIFEMLHGGLENTYSNPGATWQMDMASTGEFGWYVRSDLSNYRDFGFWTASISDGASGSDKLSGTLNGYFLSYKKEGTLAGNFLGNLKPDTTGATTGIWQGTSAGSWEKTRDVTFSSGIVGDNFRLQKEIKGDGGSNYYNMEQNPDGTYRWANFDSTTTSTSGTVTTTTTARTKYDRQGPPNQKEYSKTVWIEQKVVDSNPTNPTTTYAYTLQEAGKLTSADFNAAIDTLRIYKNTAAETTDNYWIGRDNQHDGILAGFDTNPWLTAGMGNATNVSLIGKYEQDESGAPTVFGGTAVSFDPLVDMNPYNNSRSPLGGAYYGYLGAAFGARIVAADWLDGLINGLYRDPSGNVGIFSGKFTGNNNPQVDAWTGTGTIEGGYALGTAGSGLTEANFASKVMLSNDDWSYGAADVAVTGDNVQLRANRLNRAKINGSLLNPSDSGFWGVWQSRSGGTFSGTPADWVSAIPEYLSTTYSAVHLNTTANGVKTGDTAGANVDPVNGITTLVGGTMKGLFDPATSTWQAITQGAFMETATFLNKVNNMDDNQRAAFTQATHIPAIEVGKATLSQGSGTVNNLSGVTMTDVTFFANSTGGAPRIWATDKVNGSYSAAPSVTGPAVPLSGGGLTANFGIQNWNAATWGAKITNGTGALSGGTYNGNVNFIGGAAGKVNAGGSFSGTAAGTAK